MYETGLDCTFTPKTCCLGSQNNSVDDNFVTDGPEKTCPSALGKIPCALEQVFIGPPCSAGKAVQYCDFFLWELISVLPFEKSFRYCQLSNICSFLLRFSLHQCITYWSISLSNRSMILLSSSVMQCSWILWMISFKMNLIFFLLFLKTPTTFFYYSDYLKANTHLKICVLLWERTNIRKLKVTTACMQ